MTYNRTCSWSKEFGYELETTIFKNTNLKVISSDEIESGDVKLSTLKTLQLFLQKGLNLIGLMSYGGYEYAEKYVLKSKNSSEEIICKGIFSGDYLIGIEIEYKNINEEVLTTVKTNLREQFPDYEVIWTEK